MPVAITPNGTEGVGAVGEGIIGRDATVVEHAVDFAERAGEVLGVVLAAAIANREK